MNKFFNNLNNREKYLIFGAISFAVIALIFIYANRIMNDLNVSEKRLNKAKSDYQYVVSKAELLNSKLINTSADINQIEAYITDLFSNSTKDLKVENSNEFLKISFNINNLKDAVSASEEISKTLQRQTTKILYSNEEQNTSVELYFINS